MDNICKFDKLTTSLIEKEQMKILITGANGQLGLSLNKIANKYPELNFIFTDINELDITNYKSVQLFFKKNKPDYCINAAAYTNVDKAEEEVELNTLINQIGPKNLAKASNIYNTTLIHISSDYVYNSNSEEMNFETSPTTPLGEYAKSKLAGEKEVEKYLKQHFIVRTSWLYSEFGNNFVKTIIRYGKQKEYLNVVNDQIGSPTYATDLANAIILFINNGNKNYGIFNYSNSGNISWYDFAKEIVNLNNINCKINSIPSDEYPTLEKKKKNSRISKDKIRNTFSIHIPNWGSSLKKCLTILN